MNKLITDARILLLEDDESDAELAARELTTEGLFFDWKRVQTRNEFLNEIESFRPDVILSEYSLSEFDALTALRLLKERKIDIPFILRTGASNEGSAVACMKEGAFDYILKSSLKRLPSAVLNAIEVSRYREAEKKANDALLDNERRLQQAQKMEAIGNLTGGVAHDFNNLLMSILGNTQLALRKIEPESPARHRILEIEKAAKKAAELTRKLLAYSRRQHLERRTIHLNQHTEEIMRLLERVIGENVEITVNFERDLPTVYADPAQIEQVVMNLSINARDAMPEGGHLIIETCSLELDQEYCTRFPYVQPGRYVRMKVSDTGTGMDAETIQHIFEPFYTTKDQGKGTGLGLSMVYGIVKQHDGHIHVESEVGKGTTFEMFLPVDERNVQADKIVPMKRVHRGTETILVAEDEVSLRTIAKDALESLGYTVLLAKDGDEAVELFRTNRDQIQLMLFDVIMPRMSGIRAYEQIHKLEPNVPLILMTGYSSETVQSRFIQSETSADDLGAAVIQKPFDLDILGQRVREVLDAPRYVMSSGSTPKPATPATVPTL